MPKIENIEAQEIIHKNHVIQVHKESIDLFNNSYSLFLEAIEESRHKFKENKDREFNNVFLSMCMKINGDVRVIYAALETGWYGTALCLMREIYDAINKIILISYQPEYARQISTGKMRNKDVKVAIKKHKITSVMDDKIWGMISEVKHAEANGIMAYGNLSHSPISSRFIPSINDYYFESLLAETCWWMITVAERIRYYILSKYAGVFISKEFSSEVPRLVDSIINRLRILKTKTFNMS